MVSSSRGSFSCQRIVYATNAYTPTILPEFANDYDNDEIDHEDYVLRPCRGQCVS